MNKKRPGFNHFVIVIPATQCLIFSNVRNYFRLKIMIKSKVNWGRDTHSGPVDMGGDLSSKCCEIEFQ